MDGSHINTHVDSLIEVFRRNKVVELGPAAKEAGMRIKEVERWARVLEERGIVEIQYKLTRTFVLWKGRPAEKAERLTLEAGEYVDVSLENNGAGEASFARPSASPMKKNLEVEKGHLENVSDGAGIHASASELAEKREEELARISERVSSAGTLISNLEESLERISLAEKDARNRIEEAKENLRLELARIEAAEEACEALSEARKEISSGLKEAQTRLEKEKNVLFSMKKKKN